MNQPIKPDRTLMQAAIDVADRHQTPFGAVLAMGDEIFVEAANQTRQLHDPTAHAELLAIRRLSDQVQKTDLSGFTLYTTCEPCPMCAGAAVWANIRQVIFGCSISEIAAHMPQIMLESDEIYQKSRVAGDIQNVRGFMHEECLRLLRRYG
ncbi:MAG: nucleoside deaminase [Bacteroidetes bacterium]|nr:nucleoside deaminase [Bacteroidota bacterium]